MMGPLLFVFFELFLGRKIKSLYSQGQKLFLLIFLGAFSALAFLQMRWSPYAEILGLFFIAPFLGRCLQKGMTLHSKFCAAISQVLILLTIAFWHVLLAMFLLQMSPEKTLGDSFTVPLHEVNERLSQFDQPLTILTDINFGPQILYETPHSVIATPYHRNAGGILFLNDVMSCEDFDKVKNKLYSRQVAYILIAPESSEGKAFSANPQSFYHTLISGPIPPWLVPVSLDLPEDSPFRLYKVTLKEQ